MIFYLWEVGGSSDLIIEMDIDAFMIWGWLKSNFSIQSFELWKNEISFLDTHRMIPDITLSPVDFVKAERYCQAVRRMEFDRQLGPYELNRYGDWKRLSNYITKDTIQRLGMHFTTLGTLVTFCRSCQSPKCPLTR